MSRSRPRGAPEPTKTASQPSARRARIESISRAAAELDAELEHVAGLLVDHFLGQAKARDLRADHSAGLRVAVEDDDFVAERRQVARDGQRRRAGADAGDALAVLAPRLRGRYSVMSSLKSAATRFSRQIATGSGLRRLRFLDPAAPAGGLAGPVAGAPEDAGEDIGFPVDEVGVGVAAGRDQADVLGDWGVGRAGPLAIDDFVKVVGIADIGGSQISLSSPAERGGCTALAQKSAIRC